MDHVLFCTLIRNLLHTNVLALEDRERDLDAFEQKHCYNRVLQGIFTRESLASVLDGVRERCIYGLRDELGICLHLFAVEGQIFLVGPFVKSEFDTAAVRRLLIRRRVPASFLPSLRLYYSAFPILSSYQVRGTVMACIRSISYAADDYDYQRLRGPAETALAPAPGREENLDYSSLYARYDLENRFLRTIETGDTEHVLLAYNDMSGMSLRDASQQRYVNAVYQDPSVGLSIIRALARKSAERGGASVVQIDEITQRAVQRIANARDQAEQMRCTREMLLELTEAVRLHRLHAGNYSAPVQKTLEYLGLNYSQALRLPTLARRAAISEAYLSRCFRKEVGMSISQYIAHLRCTQAAQMLRDGDFPIQEISQYVGYEDNNYFVKVFKKHYGMTPSDYRAGAPRPS